MNAPIVQQLPSMVHYLVDVVGCVPERRVWDVKRMEKMEEVHLQ